MATTFYANKPVDAKPQHTGTVIYADDTCARTLSSELLGGGGGMEIAGGAITSISLILIFIIFILDLTVEEPVLIFSWLFGISALLIILPILLFRYKPNYPIFSRKSQEIYYVRSPKNIIKFKWADVKAEYRRVAVFTGSAVSQIDTLTLIGTSQYGDTPPKPAVIAFVVADEENAKEFWAYLQTYMKNGAEGLEEPSYDRVKEGFIPEVKRLTSQIFYYVPRFVLSATFSPSPETTFLKRILLFLMFPLAILFFPIAIIFIWPGEIARAFVGSTRKRAPIPDDLLPYVTDNPESWGKENSN